MKIEGRYFDGSRKPITKKVAIQIVNELSKTRISAVLKVTVDTSSGRGVRLLDLKDGVDQTSKESIEVLFEKMGNNLVLQESIRQHPQISRIYPHSINTLRVISYQINDEIFIAPITLRIGQGGNKVDNAHAGGMFVGVKDNGKLCAEAFTEYQKRYRNHPDTGVVFDGYQLPFIDEIKRAAVELHMRIPMFQFVSWDMSVSDDNKIVLVEANLCTQSVWFPQMAHGKSLFGDHTAAFLKQARDSH